MSQTLRQVGPGELSYEYVDKPVFKYLDHTVIAQYRNAEPTGDPTEDYDGFLGCWMRPWPGPQKNVFVWWLLEGNIAVGWNENPARGWSFPVIRIEEA